MEYGKIRLRTSDAAAYLGLSPRTLESLRHRGEGPAFAKLGRAVVYDTRDLDRWFEERTASISFSKSERPNASCTAGDRSRPSPASRPEEPR